MIKVKLIEAYYKCNWTLFVKTQCGFSIYRKNNYFSAVPLFCVKKGAN